MSHKRSIRLFLVPVLALVALAGVTGAAASPPSPASGTFTYTQASFNSVREAGGNIIIDVSNTVNLTGTMEGTSTSRGTLIFHADGSANFHGVEVFTGTVNGVPGTLTFNVSGQTHNEVYQANAVIVRGTGALSTLHGMLNQVGAVSDPNNGPQGTYTGQLQTAP